MIKLYLIINIYLKKKIKKKIKKFKYHRKIIKECDKKYKYIG